MPNDNPYTKTKNDCENWTKDVNMALAFVQAEIPTVVLLTVLAFDLIW